MSAAAALIIPQALEWIGGFFGRRNKIAEATTQARIEQRQRGISSWAGRMLALFWFYPAVAGYIPPLQESAANGLRLLQALPEWYLGVLLTITCAVFGVTEFKRWKR